MLIFPPLPESSGRVLSPSASALRQRKLSMDGLPVNCVSRGDLEIDAGSHHNAVPNFSASPPHHMDGILALLAAAQKYDTCALNPPSTPRSVAGNLPTQTGERAFRAYAIASGNRLGGEKEMGSAACLTLDCPMTFDHIGKVKKMFEGWAQALRRPASLCTVPWILTSVVTQTRTTAPNIGPPSVREYT
ncbi:hypothetical protein BC826DRAFT_967597 [Russula brevipes]|nr:hypothetical protein BC826DRAFT_967597 [Russula brevipes]